MGLGPPIASDPEPPVPNPIVVAPWRRFYGPSSRGPNEDPSFDFIPIYEHHKGGSGGPTNTILPQITGSLVQGQTLTCSTGTWIGSPTSYAYQWYSNGVPVGTNQNTYTTQVSDVGNFIDCTVAASNASGTGYATAVPVGPVTAVAVGNIIPEVTYHSLVMN